MFDPNFKFPAVHEWTLNIQREVPSGLVAQARLPWQTRHAPAAILRH
jgi:hypothetical protein